MAFAIVYCAFFFLCVHQANSLLKPIIFLIQTPAQTGVNVGTNPAVNACPVTSCCSYNCMLVACTLNPALGLPPFCGPAPGTPATGPCTPLAGVSPTCARLGCTAQSCGLACPINPIPLNLCAPKV